MKLVIKGVEKSEYLSVRLIDILNFKSVSEVVNWNMFSLEGVTEHDFNVLELEEQVHTSEDGKLFSYEELCATAQKLIQVIDLDLKGYAFDAITQKMEEVIAIHLEDGGAWEIDVDDENMIRDLETLPGSD